jgi:hypothetical protein
MLLGASGLFQMSANPNYEGFLAITNTWAWAILFKHIIIFGMVVTSAILTWSITPGLQRAALKRARGLEAPETDRLQKSAVRLITFNLVLGMVVLVLTAVARIS